MLSLFPTLLSYQELSPLIIRIVLAITIAYFGYQKIKNRGQDSEKGNVAYGVVDMALAILLFIGLYTQLAAIILAIMLVIKLVFKVKEKKFLTEGVNYYLLLLVMAVSLILTGAGWCAIDLPL